MSSNRPELLPLIFWVSLVSALFVPQVSAQVPDAQTIIERSVQAIKKDFAAAPDYNHKERDRTPNGAKLYQITILDGTPYQRLMAENGKPLSQAQEAEAMKKQQQAEAQHHAESANERRSRIANYRKDLARDHNMYEQLTEAFDFKLVGQGKLRGFNVYKLRATPKPGYRPPNIECQALPGMQGQLWVDQKTFQWVKVTAQVVRPVSIEGFLAQVEPGTRFELEKAPVGNGIWLPSHFKMKSHSKVFFLINHYSSQNQTFFDYVSANDAQSASDGSKIPEVLQGKR